MTGADGLAGSVSWFRFVPHGRVAAYRFAGWLVEPTAPSHHDRFSVLMRYGKPSEGEPPEPARGARPTIRPAGATSPSGRLPRRRG